ncbi:LamB/YcsF family protein [Desertibacillus haloalkaliphilus]|uniref:LamB/YcsF family protein n=1 Tax=Desertibacillus haloalkaliphilus TaxID=1328930 RepID=UPI001C280619|nr:5-oxoprolinase subunit PxpA [Desertibacillus haloalkaliphilus]MBU8907546.1 LamB/YcsF family protein [Desertibacillus haloalkaliphilus]
MNHQIDLNSDLGESFGAYRIGQDDQVLTHVTSANIACGYHAGDHNVMHKTVKLAIENNVALGAHPGIQDLIGFGRRVMQLDPKDVYNFTVYQIGALQAFAKVYQTNLQHVKPHGALFNMASKDQAIAKAIAEAVYDVDPTLILFGLSGGELVKAGKGLGLQVAQEVFSDRTYQPDGTLTPRTEPNAMIEDADEAVERVIQMITKGTVEAVDGSTIPLQADTICVHGDEPSALEFVKNLKSAFAANKIEVAAIGKNI